MFQIIPIVKCKYRLSFAGAAITIATKLLKEKKKNQKQTKKRRKKKNSGLNVLQTQRAPHGKQTLPLISASLQSRLHRFVNSTKAGGREKDIMVIFRTQGTMAMTFES